MGEKIFGNVLRGNGQILSEQKRKPRLAGRDFLRVLEDNANYGRQAISAVEPLDDVVSCDIAENRCRKRCEKHGCCLLSVASMGGGNGESLQYIFIFGNKKFPCKLR